jgi:uncharacterized membrane protein
MIFFSMFLHSWYYPPALITQIAQRFSSKALSPAAIRYTRTVTLVWCGFFLVNGAISLWTAYYASLAIWTLYNGFISYMLIGGLFVAEYLVRWCVKKRVESPETAS